MQFKKIILNNIGAYKGAQEINLTTNPPNKNVVLFGGENGSGKTTLLNSIRLALFGAFAYGYATENDHYFKNIYSLLNKTALARGEDLFQIIIEYEEVEDFERNQYRLTRRWQLSNGKPKETFIVKRNDAQLSETDKDIYHTRLKETVPPELFNLCLFDGEEISRIVNDNELSNYLKSASQVIFNLHLFNSLEKDLTTYMNNSLDEKQLSLDEEEIITIDNKIRSLKQKLQNLEIKEFETNEKINNLEQQIKSDRKHFELHGGLAKKERDELQEEVNKIEQIRKSNSEKFKEFTSTLLPFLLAKDLLHDVKRQMELEQSFELYEQVATSLTEDKMNSLLKTITENSKVEISNPVEVSQSLRSEFLSLFPAPDVEYVHRVSFEQRSKIEAILDKVDNINPDDFINLLEENQTLLDKAKEIRKKIEVNDSTEDFKELLDKIDVATQEIMNNKQLLITIQEQQETLTAELEALTKESTIKKQRLSDKTKLGNSFLLASQIKEVSSKFRLQQQKKKLMDVEIAATKMLNSLMRKKSYVSSIQIDPNSYEIKLYNSNKDELLIQRLSSGEKEVLLLSISWAMYTCSRIRLPFVFDTLLGRLDKTHKQTILTKFIPKCGDQVIILSTDSEIDPFHYDMIKPYLAKEYMLEFITEEERVEIHPHYFHSDEVEVPLS
ncbi:DNA sulfur modification protein DndD [Halalkalibacter urbisdiaboli]|uniref:DNA sulfur modification protein DndD n=1 Tax=Halalkalibacter urbisdiaboli TaxID=1960589 RepID=UPI000B42E12B|nr:DNA sulfur modification protein DndD [Halalkalibacter urbisdiaboli]